MKAKTFTLVLAAAVAFVADDAYGLGKKDKGCLVGGAAGGVGGHVLGDHALLGAAAGCAVGAIVADKRDQKQQDAKKREEEQRKHAYREHRRDRVVRDEHRAY